METQEILTELKKKGFRITNIRKKLIGLFAKTKMPLSIQELLRGLEREGVAANKTTLYREMYFLMEQGIVDEIDFGDRKKRYESAHSTHHHHLVCLKCSKVKDVILSRELKKEELRIGRENSFTITSHSLEFFGLCNQCTT